MNATDIIRSIEQEQLKAEVDEFRVGDTVKVYGKIKEGNRERIQVFEGIVLKRQGGSNRETFTVNSLSASFFDLKKIRSFFFFFFPDMFWLVSMACFFICLK